MSCCVLCVFYHPEAEPRFPDRTQTCEFCRRRLERDRLTVRSLYLRLAELDQPVVDVRTGDRTLRDHRGEVTVVADRPRDPVAHRLPMAPTPGRSNQPMVSGSKPRTLPIDVDRTDLTAQAQTGAVSDPHGDQVGHLSVATVLNEWVAQWCERYFSTESRPEPEAVRLLDWLGGVRLAILCEAEPAIADFADELSRLRLALRGALHEIPPRPVVMWGVPCRRCRKVSQLVLDPDDPDQYRECVNPGCGLLLTKQEYRDYLKAEVERIRRAVAEDAKV